MAAPFDEGYPRSTVAALDPGLIHTVSLDHADHEAGGEHRIELQGRRPDGAIEDDERFEEADALDDAESHHQLAGGRD